MQRLSVKISKIIEDYRKNIMEPLEKILKRNDIPLSADDVLEKMDVEYEIISLSDSISVRSDDEMKLVESLQEINQIAKKAFEKVVSGYPVEINVSLKIKTVLAEEFDTDLKKLISRMTEHIRGVKLPFSGWRIIGDLIIDQEDGVYLTIEIDVYVPPVESYTW